MLIMYEIAMYLGVFPIGLLFIIEIGLILKSYNIYSCGTFDNSNYHLWIKTIDFIYVCGDYDICGIFQFKNLDL